MRVRLSLTAQLELDELANSTSLANLIWGTN